jgi:hypothetical protein
MCLAGGFYVILMLFDRLGKPSRDAQLRSLEAGAKESAQEQNNPEQDQKEIPE